jgi:hypothetical protein
MTHGDRTIALTEFRRAAGPHLRRLRQSGRPELIAVGGKPTLVIQDAAAYQRLLDRLAAAGANVQRRT